MTFLQLDSLPPRTSKGDILQLLIETGGLARSEVGRIDLRGALATVEIPPEKITRVVQKLDGAMLRDRRIAARALEARQTGGLSENHFQCLARLLEIEAQAETK